MNKNNAPYSARRFHDDPGGRGLMCNECKHNLRDGTCKAFPEGIPKGILEREEHDTAYPDDQGIRFEQNTQHPDHIG